ncbi:hypothetical protein IAG25_40790 [Caballeronia sp. EK]|uniref:hypothetical protein n=1 Tax=Caballeronia sp. EK TaxID=2767469 RepID=UPI0016554D15|nr:hypothetical protein [Caballeronia sp. EK]MBC8643050.1 hypothetical protein [Caballeronia sp. EK]
MTSVTNRTVARALSGIESGNSSRNPTIILQGKNFGNKGWGVVKDIILSMITFGIYAVVKNSKMDQKSTDLEAVVRELHQQMTLMGDQQTAVGVSLKDGRTLSVIESEVAQEKNLTIFLGGTQCVRIDGMTIKEFQIHIDKEVLMLEARSLNEDIASLKGDSHVEPHWTSMVQNSKWVDDKSE